MTKKVIYGIAFLVAFRSGLSVTEAEAKTTAAIPSLAKDDVRLTIDEQGIVTANDSEPTVDRLSTANLSPGVHYLDSNKFLLCLVSGFRRLSLSGHGLEGFLF